MQFSILYCDPPWKFECWSSKGTGRSAEQHYPVLSFTDLKALPVAAVAARDCALLLWATNPMLPQALEVMGTWSFEFKTVAFVWTKPGIGLGYWTRSGCEL